MATAGPLPTARAIAAPRPAFPIPGFCADVPIGVVRVVGPTAQDYGVPEGVLASPERDALAPNPHAHVDHILCAVLREAAKHTQSPSVVMHLVGLALETARAGKFVGNTDFPPDVVRDILSPVREAVERGTFQFCDCADSAAAAAPVPADDPTVCAHLAASARLALPRRNAEETIRLPLIFGRDRDLDCDSQDGWISIPYVIDFAPLLVYTTFFQRQLRFGDVRARPHGVLFRADVAVLHKLACEIDRRIIPVVDNCCWLWYARAASRGSTDAPALGAAANFFCERIRIPRDQRTGAIQFISACARFLVTLADAESPGFLDGAAAAVASEQLAGDLVYEATNDGRAAAQKRDDPIRAARTTFVAGVCRVAHLGAALRTELPECDPTRIGSTWGRREYATPGTPAVFYAAASSLHTTARVALNLDTQFDEVSAVREGFDALRVQPFVVSCLPENLLTAAGNNAQALIALEAAWSCRFSPVTRVGLLTPPLPDAGAAFWTAHDQHRAEDHETFQDTRFLQQLDRVSYFAQISPHPRLGVPTIAQYFTHTARASPTTNPRPASSPLSSSAIF